MVARTLVGGEIRSSHPPISGVRWDRSVPAGNGYLRGRTTLPGPPVRMESGIAYVPASRDGPRWTDAVASNLVANAIEPRPRQHLLAPSGREPHCGEGPPAETGSTSAIVMHLLNGQKYPLSSQPPRAVMTRRPKWSRTPEWSPRPTQLGQQGKRVGPIVDEVDRRPARADGKAEQKPTATAGPIERHHGHLD